MNLVKNPAHFEKGTTSRLTCFSKYLFFITRKVFNVKRDDGDVRTMIHIINVTDTSKLSRTIVSLFS